MEPLGGYYLKGWFGLRILSQAGGISVKHFYSIGNSKDSEVPKNETVDWGNSTDMSKNKNTIDVIDPFPDIFDNFDSLFIYSF